MDMKIGGREIVSNQMRVSRMTGLIWGSAGGGKTTLASTAPGRKLLINFDADGPNSIVGIPDVDVADFTDPALAIVGQFKSPDPLSISAVIERYDTIIVDSLTNIGFKCLQYGITQSKGATIERPDPQAYQVRNSLVTQLVKNMLSITSKYSKHLFFIAHEDEPVKHSDGSIVHITLSLGGKLPEQTALDFSEVWCMQDMGVGRHRRIAFRPARHRKPMKTRMFETTGEPEFDWVYNPDTNEGMTIAGWYEQWKANGFKKIPIPQDPAKKGKKT